MVNYQLHCMKPYKYHLLQDWKLGVSFITQTINNTLHDYEYLQVTRFKLLLFQLYAQY